MTETCTLLRIIYILLCRVAVPSSLLLHLLVVSFKNPDDGGQNPLTGCDIRIIIFTFFIFLIGPEHTFVFFSRKNKRSRLDFECFFLGVIIEISNTYQASPLVFQGNIYLRFSQVVFYFYLVASSVLYLVFITVSYSCAIYRRIAYGEPIRLVGLRNEQGDPEDTEEQNRTLTLREIEEMQGRRYEIQQVQISFDIESNKKKLIIAPLLNKNENSSGQTSKIKENPEKETVLAEICPICQSIFEEGEEVLDLPSCKHFYHSECIKPWLVQNNKCPMCRSQVKPDSRTSTLDISQESF
jgi:Ring finger domain